MKKTKYSYMVAFSYTTFSETYRRVWVDKNGEYFVKYNGEIRNVTAHKEKFVED